MRLTKKKASPKDILQLLGNGPMSVPAILSHYGTTSPDGDGSEIWMSVHFLRIRDQIVNVDGRMAIATSADAITEETVLEAIGAEQTGITTIVGNVLKRFRTVHWNQAHGTVQRHLDALAREGRIVRSPDGYAVVRQAEVVKIPEAASAAEAVQVANAA